LKLLELRFYLVCKDLIKDLKVCLPTGRECLPLPNPLLATSWAFGKLFMEWLQKWGQNLNMMAGRRDNF
jgi:hypothetical protein